MVKGITQSKDISRKVELRRRLLTHVGEGPVWLPFCGDGDIAAEVYQDRKLWGADTDPERVKTAQVNHPTGHFIKADCSTWPKLDMDPVVVADFDAWDYPYDALRAWWEEGPKADRVAIFGTDAQRFNLARNNQCRMPDGTKEEFGTRFDKMQPRSRRLYNMWWKEVVRPWLEDYFAPWKITHEQQYLQGQVLYWGIVVEKREEAGEATKDEGPRGRKKPVKFTPEKQDEYIGHLKAGRGFYQAAKLVDIHPAQASALANLDDEFRNARLDAVATADKWKIEEVEDALLTAATSGNVTAILAFLYSRHSEKWSDRRNQGPPPPAPSEPAPERKETLNEFLDKNPEEARKIARLLSHQRKSA